MHGCGEITFERLRAALEDLASLVVNDERYLPVFERLMREHDAMKDRLDSLSRAQDLLRQKPSKTTRGDRARKMQPV
jgi:hypothetical protein